MKVTYIGPADATRIAATGQLVLHGATVEVSDDLGASLCEQAENWKPAKATAAKKAAASKAEDTTHAATAADPKE